MISVIPLENAIAQLEEALALGRSHIVKAEPRLARHMRAAAIQAFEFTYELAFKTLKRFLAETESDPSSIASLDFNGVVRMGFARGLLAEEVAGWRQFRDHRSVTSHTYDEQKAQSVLADLPRFLAEAHYLHARLLECQDMA